MNNLRRRIAIFGILLVVCGILFACACEFAPAQNVEGQIIAAQYGEFKVPGEKTGSFLFPSDVCQVSGGGKNFSAFATGRAVKIVDSDPSKIEIATPSSVFINQCAVNMSTAYTHVPPYYLTSGTGGLQEAITANQTNNGVNSIILNWEWYAEIQPRSAATVIGSVTGITSLGLVDITVTPYQYYRWNGSQYVAIPTNGSVALVGLTAPSSVFGVTGSPVTVSGNLGLTLNSQAQNTAFMGPSTGGTGAVGFRTFTAADVAQAGSLYNAITSGNINGMMYPAQCGSANPPSWCSGTTPDAWVRAACTQLPAAGGFINFLGLTGNWAASAPCSTPTKQVITLVDNSSRIDITETDGLIAMPQDNGSMIVGQGAGQCNFVGAASGGGGIRLTATANVKAIVGPVHTDGTQENLTVDGTCLFGKVGATVAQSLIYSERNFANTTISNNVVSLCNTACGKILNNGQTKLENNWFNVADGLTTGLTGTPLIIQGSGLGNGCNVGPIEVSGGQYEHALGGGAEILVKGDGTGGPLACDIHIHDTNVERNPTGTPGTVGVQIEDCKNCSVTDLLASGQSSGSQDLVKIISNGSSSVANVVLQNVSNIFGTYTNTLNDTTPTGKVLSVFSQPILTTYYSNPGYTQPPVLPGTTMQSVDTDVMAGAGGFSTGSGSLGTGFVQTGCNVTGLNCTYTRDGTAPPPGYSFSQHVQITSNTYGGSGFNGVQWGTPVSFVKDQQYTASVWGKGDGSFTGLPTFLLWISTTPVTYCQGTNNTPFTTSWVLYSFNCTPSVSGTANIAISGLTPIGATGTFSLGGFIFAPVKPLAPACLLTSVTPYGIGCATTAQQTITLGTTALLLGNTYTAVAGLALTTSSINGVTPTTGGSASTYLNGAGAYTAPSLTGTTGTITGTALSATCNSGTATVTGAVVGHPVVVSSTTGADVGGAFYLRGSVTSTNTVTVYVCGTGTPASLAYNATVF